jgi:hypothetical protein
MSHSNSHGGAVPSRSIMQDNSVGKGKATFDNRKAGTHDKHADKRANKQHFSQPKKVIQITDVVVPKAPIAEGPVTRSRSAAQN